MSQQAAWIGRMLLRELEAFQRELALFTDESLIWRVVPGVTNSAGNLALHVCGSLQFFVGAVLLRRVLTEDNRSAGPLPLQALAMR